jgi:hypothetical protein
MVQNALWLIQLMDAASGTQLWAEAYDREISDASTFQVQDDLTAHIVTTVADGPFFGPGGIRGLTADDGPCRSGLLFIG